MPLTIRLIRNTILSLLMLVALMASGLYFYWTDLRGFITDLDSDIREHYLARVQGPYERLKEEFLKQSPASPELMQQMLALELELRDVEYTDRLTPVKLDLLQQLSLYHESQQDFEEAIEWQKQLIDFFPKDIDAHYKLAELYFADGNEKAGMSKLAELFELLPENNRIAEHYLPALLASNQYSEAYEGLLQYLRLRTDATHNEWGYFFSPKKTFSREFSDMVYPEVTPGVIKIALEVPGDTGFLRLDMPNHSVLTIQRFDFSVFSDGSWLTLPENALKTQGIRRSKKFLFAPGNANQLLVWSFPAEAKSDNPMQIRLQLHYMDDIDWVTNMLQHKAFGDFMQSLAQNNRQKELKLLNKTIHSSLRKKIAVFSAGKNRLRINGGVSLDEESGKLVFEQELKRNAFRDKVDIYLPDVIAARYRIELNTAADTINALPLVTERQSLEENATNGYFQVTGPDPYLQLDLSSFDPEQTIHVTGEVL